MDTTQSSTIVRLLAALSVASERLVEIINELSSFLNQQLPKTGEELLDNVTAAPFNPKQSQDYT